MTAVSLCFDELKHGEIISSTVLNVDHVPTGMSIHDGGKRVYLADSSESPVVSCPSESSESMAVLDVNLGYIATCTHPTIAWGN